MSNTSIPIVIASAVVIVNLVGGYSHEKQPTTANISFTVPAVMGRPCCSITHSHHRRYARVQRHSLVCKVSFCPRLSVAGGQQLAAPGQPASSSQQQYQQRFLQ